MNKLILYIVAFLIGVILYKLLNDKELFNVSIQNENQNKINISQELVLNTQKYCNSNPKPKNIIGFIQPSIGNLYPTYEQLGNTNYNIFVEGFLVNYPYTKIR